MKLYDLIKNGDEYISLVGLGYVGMPIAVEFAKKGVKVIGFDINEHRIHEYKNGIDSTKEVGDEALKNTSVYFTNDEIDLKKALFHIVAVPTPINQDKTPDLSPVINASRTVGRNLRKGSIVVYESTVYPGVTEDICGKILEEESGLRCGIDFKIGYSPERINPGDKIHRLETITKIVSGMDAESLETISKVYELVIEAGVHRVSSLKVAEAAKVVENSQRDINIAFMNELAMVFDKMGIDTNEVIEAMNTKWNALNFKPGLVGGHCIGVDPYYFTYEAEKLGYHSQIILSGRKINDSMGEFVADALIKQLILSGKTPINSKVIILGITFKENCPDIRNSKVTDIIKRLNDYGIFPNVVDPLADPVLTKQAYNVELSDIKNIHNADAILFAVGHDQFKSLSLNDINSFYKVMPNDQKIIIDVKGLLPLSEVKEAGYRIWRL